MIPRTELPTQLRRLLVAQSGVVSADQLRGVGVSDRVAERLLRQDVLAPLSGGIYSEALTPSWLGLAWAGILLGGETAAIGYEGAAFLQGWRQAPPTEIRVFVAPEVKRRPRAPWWFIRAHRLGRGEPARTSAEDTVLDLASEATEDEITNLLANCLSQRRTNQRSLLAALDQRRRYGHRELLREILGDVAGGAHSTLERRYLVDVERAHGLPTAERQRNLISSHRVDGWYREYDVVLELDGQIVHSGAAAFHDMDRDNDHALLGQRSLRIGWKQVKNPCETARVVAKALEIGGWVGVIKRFRRCRLVPLD